MSRNASTLIILALAGFDTAAGVADPAGMSWPSPANGVVRYLTSGSQDLWPCFSPDGTVVLFSRRVEGTMTWELLLVPVAGGEPQRLARAPLAVSATRANWSKSNNRIAFTGTSADGRNQVWVINADGSASHGLELRGLSDQVFYPSWFPDGEHIVVMDAQDMVIKRLDLRKGEATTITDHQRILTGMPSVSPDGKWIAFAGQDNAGQRYDQTKNSVWLIDDHGVMRSVESNPGQGRAPTWSPSGEWLAFESNRGGISGLYAIFLIHPNGTGLTQVTDRVLNANHPVWSTDGRHLAFSARNTSEPRGMAIAIMDLPFSR